MTQLTNFVHMDLFTDGVQIYCNLELSEHHGVCLLGYIPGSVCEIIFLGS